MKQHLMRGTPTYHSWRLRHGVDLSTALTTPANPAQRFQRS